MLTTTADLPAGVEALLPEGDVNQALLFIRAVGCLVTGDVFSGTGEPVPRVPSTTRTGESSPRWLPRSAALPVRSVPIAHGGPVLADGAARIREAVAEAAR